jgi:hypothetical protein
MSWPRSMAQWKAYESNIACGNGGSNFSRQGRSGRQIEAANANLSPCPRSLHDLWTEYMDLEGGNQRLSSHTENVESQSIGIFVGM